MISFPPSFYRRYLCHGFHFFFSPFLSRPLSLSLFRPRRQSWNRVNRHISYLRVTSVRIYREEIGTLQFLRGRVR